METKALIYCRVSSDKQVQEGSGLDSQERLCRDYTDKHQYEVIKIFREEGISGGLFERPAMRSLITFLDDNPLEKYIVVFDDLKRFARDVNVHLQLKAQLLSRGVRLECPNFRFEDSPEGRLIENVTAATSQYERESNKRQVIQKMRARLTQGYWCFRSPPRGIKYIKDTNHGKLLVCDEPLASIYKEAIELYEKNSLNTLEETQQYIQKRYVEKNVVRSISISGTRAILSELLYTGYIEYSPWKIPLMKGKHTGFISLDTYKNVQDKLSGKAKIHIRADYSVDFPLRTFVECSVCKKPLTGAWTKGRNPNKKFPYYWCRNKECLNKYKSIQKTELEGSFKSFLQGVKVNNGLTDLTETILLKLWKETKEGETILRINRDNQKTEFKDKIDGLSERISTTKDELLISVYENKIKEYLGEIKNIEKIDRKVNYTQEQFQTASNLVFSTLKEPVRMWESDKYQCKTTIIQMYFKDRLSYDLKQGFQTPALEPTINLINDIGTQKVPLVEMPGIGPGSGETPIYKRLVRDKVSLLQSDT